ncbi:MAG: hypothetical protein MI717_04830 [Spirochaetales bacterium]|nr:hypothetical protein [Spirochaetales bacterium]
MSSYKRVEIIANHSVEQDIMDGLEIHGLAQHRTKIPNVHGQGYTDPKQGDHIWPEENFILIVYCDAEEAAAIEAVVKSVKERFPQEGLRFFVL